MRSRWSAFILMILLSLTITAGNKILSPQIKTLQAVVNDDWLTFPNVMRLDQDLKGMRKWYDYFHENYPGKLYAISEFGNIPKVSEFWADGQYWSFLIPWYDYDRTTKPSSEAFNSTDHNNANIDYWNDALSQDYVITRDELPDFK